MATESVSPKSLDPRTRPFVMRLPIEVELFYAAQGDFVRDCSTTRAMEQFLLDRATVPDNIKAIASAVRVRARLLGKTPHQVLKECLEDRKYGEFLNLDNTAEALCLAWGLDPYEKQETT